MAEIGLIPPAVVIATLEALGMATLYTQRAAADTRIEWTDAALEACAHDIDTSTMRKPANALWSTYLSKGQLPPLPRLAPVLDMRRCPVTECDAGGDLSVCHGVHGWVRLLPCWSCGRELDACRGTCLEPAQEKAA